MRACRCVTRWEPRGMWQTLPCSWPPMRRISSPGLPFRSMGARWSTSTDTAAGGTAGVDTTIRAYSTVMTRVGVISAGRAAEWGAYAGQDRRPGVARVLPRAHRRRILARRSRCRLRVNGGKRIHRLCRSREISLLQLRANGSAAQILVRPRAGIAAPDGQSGAERRRGRSQRARLQGGLRRRHRGTQGARDRRAREELRKPGKLAQQFRCQIGRTLAWPGVAIDSLTQLMARDLRSRAERFEFGHSNFAAHRSHAAVGARNDAFLGHESCGLGQGGGDFLGALDRFARDVDHPDLDVFAREQSQQLHWHPGISALDRNLVNAALGQGGKNFLVLSPLAPERRFPIEIGFYSVA